MVIADRLSLRSVFRTRGRFSPRRNSTLKACASQVSRPMFLQDRLFGIDSAVLLPDCYVREGAFARKVVAP
jgi:hypothetical protein